jgi:hypothetical protein
MFGDDDLFVDGMLASPQQVGRPTPERRHQRHDSPRANPDHAMLRLSRERHNSQFLFG